MKVNSLAGIRLEIITSASFVLMIVVNFLANFLPINGVTTGQVADYYPNLFVPAATTFAIWGLIYMLLAGYVFYQLGVFKGKTDAVEEVFLNKIRLLFICSSLANTFWVFSWHYFLVPLSMLLIMLIFLCLFYILHIVKKYRLTMEKEVFIRIPFSVYFGWITVAVIANLAALAESMKWNNFGLEETTWTIALILAGEIIGIALALRYSDVVYGLAIIWAYSGILVKHISESGFSGQYPHIIIVTASCIALLILTLAYIFFCKKRYVSND